MLYFDHNATSPMLPEARRVWLEAAARFIGNPSSPHRLGARAEAALQTARQKLATILGCEGGDIVWTSGATESANMVFHHQASAGVEKAEAWVSAIDHPCVLASARRHFPKGHRLIPVLPSGVVDLDWLERALARRRPALVAAMAANNETGVLQPWPEIQALCRAREVPFFCDAVQWIGKLPARGLGACDCVSGSAHKFGGPRGIGFLKCPPGKRFTPLLLGGQQEDGRRAGTENVPGALAMAAALEIREAAMKRAAFGALQQRRTGFERELLRRLPNTEIVGVTVPRLWNTVLAIMPEIDCRQRWVVKFDKAGCAVSTGSACASGREEPSHVLAAMDYSPQAASRALRFSSGWETKAAEWRQLRDILGRVSAIMQAGG